MQPKRGKTESVWGLLNEPISNEPGVEKKPLILIADDDPLHLTSLSRLLALCEYSCKTVGSGAEALEALKANGFDLLLLDIHMPGIDGHQVLDRLKSWGSDVPVIMISGDASWDKATATLRQGADDFIRKPYSPEEIVSCIRSSLEKRRLRAQNTEYVEKLHVSEQLHRFLVNQSPDLIFILDCHGRFRFVNKHAETLFGVHKKLIIGKPISRFLLDECPFLTSDPDAWGEHPKAIRNIEVRLRKCPTGKPLVAEDNVAVELSAERIHGTTRKDGTAVSTGTYGVARDITGRKQAEAKITYQAYHDLLTGLPNRMLFRDRVNLAIKQAHRDGSRLAIMFLDLDRFKLVNDTLGHSKGDHLLQEVAKRIQGAIRDADTLARIGGDEFVLLLPQIRHPEDAEVIADKIQHSQQAPFMIDDRELFASTSIGIAVYPEHGDTADLLIQRADMAMYAAKNSGKSSHGFYAKKMQEEYTFKLGMEQDLRKALEGSQLQLHYQPLVHISDRSLISMEALIRWNHPDKGLLKPDAFIHEAEENGLIVEIGQWVLRRVIQDLKASRDSGQQPVPVSINVSSLQLELAGFAGQIQKLLAAANLPGRLLQIELTENVLMKNMHSVISTLRELNALDIKIIIDDFGTGYSSLSYLKMLPIMALKIDQTFLGDIEPGSSRETIASTIAAMAKGLGLGLLAEGVEEESQASYLMGIGCNCAQGYLFSEPVAGLQSVYLRHRRNISVNPDYRCS